MPKIQFPLNPLLVANLIPNSRFMSYQKFAKISNCNLQDVICLCKSKSGCTHYDVNSSRYLTLINISEVYNSKPRQRWTIAHEIGHILCKHHIILMENNSSNGCFSIAFTPEYETEADYFAVTLLSPFPLFSILNIRNPLDIQIRFGISNKAANIRFEEYKKWKKSHRKTAWENDIVKVYKSKAVEPHYEVS